ncbi:hypothetical protein A4D02_27645 [Niastella koreensis]|uniref:Phosphate-selective porin O and P n=2 Tax=Niastella koreensis TaxID=354356 RepID=G8TI14_NIAKG|nr:hypothetical protein [Niastella koreensis]AEV99617.1 hypothetical protein Niako_3293 [Niastella koreensis GR20-10]OQP50205.1 hypothetical protein A4D02_27645 [Niastella koreensis]
MRIGPLVTVFVFIACSAKARQQNQQQPDTSFKPTGKLWGYAFADYYYKGHSDSLNRGVNQYSNIEQGRNAFQFRRIYLGYNYEIHPKFSAEFLLAAEDNTVTRTLQPTGDLLADNKLSVYIKLANLRWKNIWKGTDLVVGQMATPAFTLLAEPIWGYRSIERTITDIRRIPSFDLGAALQGKFDPSKGNFGYDLMISNGTGARPENDKFKWLAADVYAKLLNKKLILQFYADYQRMNWTPGFHHARNILKGFASYVTPGITAGAEAFFSYGRQDEIGVHGIVNDTISARSRGISLFVRGNIIKDKLSFFARTDLFNPDVNYNEQAYEDYKGITSTFEPNNKETFCTAGVDFTPVKNVHFMPNIWYNGYTSQRHSVTGAERRDYDLVYRITFYYIYGK